MFIRLPPCKAQISKIKSALAPAFTKHKSIYFCIFSFKAANRKLATNYNFIIPISLQLADVVNLYYFKHWIMLNQIV